ncbi:MAG: polysaccharide biosynthesis/export family protein [Terriglobales bacterium]
MESAHRLWFRSAVWALVGSAFAVALAAQDSPSPAPVSTPVAPEITVIDKPAAPPASPDPSALRIGGGDLLDIRVYGVEELSQQVRVSNDGEVYLPLVGRLKVEGLTPDEAQASIEKSLIEGGFLKEPHVSILIREYATSGVSVLGEVARPGIYPLLGQRRLFDALAAAGGRSDKAGSLISITHRDRPQDPVAVLWSQDPEKSAETNVAIYPGDTIVVAKAGVVYVIGEVNFPKGILLEDRENLSVLQAIAIAQGIKKEAALGGARIIRRGPSGYQEIPLQLKAILQAKAPDVTLQEGDIVFVPASTGKHVANRTLNALLQIATGIAVFGGR